MIDMVLSHPWHVTYILIDWCIIPIYWPAASPPSPTTPTATLACVCKHGKWEVKWWGILLAASSWWSGHSWDLCLYKRWKGLRNLLRQPVSHLINNMVGRSAWQKRLRGAHKGQSLLWALDGEWPVLINLPTVASLLKPINYFSSSTELTVKLYLKRFSSNNLL